MDHHVLGLLLILVGYFGVATSKDILVLMPLPARSHFKSFQPLFEELVKRGHNLTLVSGYELSETLQGRYTYIDLKHHFCKMNINFAEMRKQNRLYNFIFCSERIVEYLEHVLRDQQIQDLISSKDSNFDSVVIELFFMDVLVAFGDIFNAPVVGLSAQMLIPFYGWANGNPTNPSYQPNLYLPFRHRMNFMERFLNSFYTGITSLYYEHVSLKKHQTLLEKYLQFENHNNISMLKNMMKNISLTFVNSHFAFGYPKPNLPNVIETAGLHITDPTPLPKNIEKFMNDAVDGIIYASLGSLIQPDDIQPMGNAFLSALGNLPQKVIFKWNPKLLPYIPNNFLVQEWVPQTSILEHPNCRLFITHGGLHSLIESVNYSVPLVGIPFFTDQQHNMALVEHLGIGKTLNIDFNIDQLSSTVQTVLSNSKYYENTRRQSAKFNDRLVSPLNTAVYWIEYIMKHDDLSSLKSASTQLQWYQYLLLDVLAFFIILFTLSLCVIYLVMKFVVDLFRRIIYFISIILRIQRSNPKVKKNKKIN